MPNVESGNWIENPNISIEIAKEIEKAYWKECKIEAVLGRGENRALRSFQVKSSAPYRPRIKQRLLGDGVEGNADFDSNVDKMEIFATTLYPKVIGNSLNSDIEFYSLMNNIDFAKEASESLKSWMVDKVNRSIVAALANDITNIVVADATKGVKDSSAKASVAEACKAIVKGDTLTVATIRRAIFMAKTGLDYKNSKASTIKPTRITTKTIAGVETDIFSYLILLDTYQVEQIKKDPEWIEAQKALATNKGLDAGFFTGLVGVIDGCPVIDMGVWTSDQVGLPNSQTNDTEFRNSLNLQNHSKIVTPSAYANSQPVSFGYLVGANALLAVGTPQARVLFEKRDYGRKTGIAVDRVLTIAKGRFDMSSSESWGYLHDKDIGIIGIASSLE